MSLSQVLVAASARAAEQTLLGLLDALLPAEGLDVAALARPVRVVVPSRSLRQHLVQRIARHRGRAMVGLIVQTLPSLSAQVLAGAPRSSSQAEPLLEVLVRRRAAEQPALAQALGGLEDGLSAVARPVADLLAAGFVAGRDAVALAQRIAALAEPAATEDERLRALAIVHTAARVQQDLAELDLALHADGHRLAAERLRAAGAAVLPARRVLIYGLVDPSGAELALVEALVAHAPSTVVLSAPPAPAAAMGGQGVADLSGPVGDLVDRLRAICPVQVDAEAARPPLLRLWAGPGRLAQARHAARRARLLVDQGVPAEAVAIVARDLAEWGPWLRPELERLGLPWSGVGGRAPAGPALRRLRALVELLHRRGDAPMDRWLDALVRVPGGGSAPVEDLRTALRSLGKARLRDVAALDLQALPWRDDALPLPVRTRVVQAPGGDAATPEGQDDAEEQAGALARRRLPRGVLQAAVLAVRSLLGGLEGEDPRPLRAWAELLRDIARQGLGWGDPEAAWRALVAALDGLLDRVGQDVLLHRDEARLVVAPALEGAATGPIGGQGAGVLLLSAVEARGRTFAHLLVLGLSRGELPRASRGDPLLSESLRLALRELLPDLASPVARQAVERDLLSHLVLAAPQVELCWPTTDDDGRVVPASPLVERLRLACPEVPVEILPAPGSRQDPLPELAGLPRPATEHALYRALHADDDDDAVACVAWALGGDAAAREVAWARAAIRRELDAPPRRLGAGPYLGFVGPVRGAADPRAGALYATTLEAVARCGWQAFLERVLRLEAAPDAEGALPGVDARLVGTVVHRVLETLTRQALDQAGASEPPADIQQLARAPDAPLRWPDAPALRALIERVAQEVAVEEGLALPGLWRVLARASEPDLEVARLAEAEDPPRVLAAEQEARVLLDTPLGPRAVAFRADRVDRWQGSLRLTDFKTGRPISTVKRPDLRRRDLLAALASGSRLQAALYARALGSSSHGRYLFVRADPGLPPESPARAFQVPPEEGDRPDFDRVLDHAAGTVIAAWLEGGLSPRLVGPDQKEPDACGRCAVKQACLQGDSTARLRQHAWAMQGPVGPGAEARAHALWMLGHTPADTDADGGQG